MRLLAVSLTALLACAHRPELDRHVEVTEAGSGLRLAPRPADCAVQLFRTRPPARAYDEVAALHLRLFGELDAAAVEDALRRRACAIGADAIVVTRDFVGSGTDAGMSGVAVSYPELRGEHGAELARREAERARADADRARAEAERRRAEAERSRRLAAMRPAGAPAGYVPATIVRDGWLREAPGRRSAERGEVRKGTAAWVAPVARDGYRRAWVAAGLHGYAEDADVALDPDPVRAPAAAR